MTANQRKEQRGVSNIEFALLLTTMITPILLGVFVFGASLVREVEAIQVGRETAELYSRNIDFSQQGNQDIVTDYVAVGLGMQHNGGNVTGTNSGNGVVVISTYLMNNTAGSVNQNHVVVTNRIVIGNNTLYTSVFGNPSPSDIQADGSIDKATAQDIHTTDRADNVSNLITLGAGNSVRMVEVYFKTIAISLSSVSSGGGHYSRAIF
jgi:hypothetical protein